MPTAITLAGADFSAAPLIKGLPALASMEGWAYFGKDLATSQNKGTAGPWTNHASGPPTYFPNYIRCINGAGAIQTPITSHTGETILLAVRQVPVTGPLGPQCIVNTVTQGGYVAFTPLTGSTGFQLYNGGSVIQNLVEPPITNWRFYAVTIGDATLPAVYDLTNATSSIGGTPTTNTAFATPRTLGTGASLNSVNNQCCDIAFYASYSRVLLKTDIDAIYASVKGSLALRGIVV